MSLLTVAMTSSLFKYFYYKITAIKYWFEGDGGERLTWSNPDFLLDYQVWHIPIINPLPA